MGWWFARVTCNCLRIVLRMRMMLIRCMSFSKLISICINLLRVSSTYTISVPLVTIIIVLSLNNTWQFIILKRLIIITVIIWLISCSIVFIVSLYSCKSIGMLIFRIMAFVKLMLLLLKWLLHQFKLLLALQSFYLLVRWCFVVLLKLLMI